MKKSKNILITSLTFLLFAYSCDSDFFDLNKEPLNLISDAFVFVDESLVEANLAQIYHQTLFNYMEITRPVNAFLESGMGAEGRGFALWQEPSAVPFEIMDESGAPSLIDYWPYSNIRNANEFIIGVQNSELSQDYKNQKISEARYLRAHMYFQMVKRYGGVPIITVPQPVDASDDELFVSRNSEKEVFDFIANELDDIVLLLPEVTEPGRICKYTALALKSRAMLYAASVAEFGSVQLNGLLGIPDNQAPNYWQASYDASMEIISSGKYSLYNNFPDNPAWNFQDIFVEEANNPERIFVEVYDFTLGKGHSWNFGAVPNEFATGWGSNFVPFLHIIDEFEYADGTPGKIDRDLIKSGHLFHIDELFKNRDPRFLATFFFPESEFQGGVAHFHKRTVYNSTVYTSGTIENHWPAAAPNRNTANTGFLVRKRIDEGEINPGRGTSKTDYMIFRYGEILLNAAEAAFYLNKPGDALNYINLIRERAGMPFHTSISENDIRHERRVELAYEDHRYWDLRRWRVAQQELDGLRTQGLEFTYHYNEDKYQLQLKNGEASVRIFQERHYYFPLGVNRLAENPNLIENPGY
jgi:starch-binding outer membrane protein, SusD/RagB family